MITGMLHFDKLGHTCVLKSVGNNDYVIYLPCIVCLVSRPKGPIIQGRTSPLLSEHIKGIYTKDCCFDIINL